MISTDTISTGSTFREKAEIEARARVFWGDRQEDVIKYLVDHGTEHGEASQIVEAFVQERAGTVRKMGFSKILIGSALIGAPLIPWIAMSVMLHRFFMPPSLILCMVPGSFVVYGVYSLLKGAQLYLWPHTEAGDIAEKD